MTKHLSTRDVFRLKFATDDLQERVARGQYFDPDLAALRRIMTSVVDDFGFQVSQIEALGNVSKAVIRSVLGGGHPKLHNFYALLNAAKIVIRKELINRGVLNYNSWSESEDDWVKIRIYTEKGVVLNAAFTLEYFIEKFRERNDLEEFIGDKQREDLIEILEAIVVQLKGPVIKIGLIRRMANQLALMGKNFGEKLADKSISEAAGKAVEALDKLI